MKVCEAIKETLKHFDTRQIHVAVAAGVDRGQFSSFLNGKRDISCSSLDEVLGVLTQDQRLYLMFTLLGEMNDRDTAGLIELCARRLRNATPQTSETCAEHVAA